MVQGESAESAALPSVWPWPLVITGPYRAQAEGQTANMARHTVFAIRYLFNSVSESFQVKFPL